MSTLKQGYAPVLPQAGWVREKAVLAFVPFGRTKLREEITAGRFPAPKKFTGRMIAFDAAAVHAWINAQRDPKEVRQSSDAAAGNAPRPAAVIVLTVLEAAIAIARLQVAHDEDLWQGSTDRVVETLRRAAEVGSLRVRHPETLLPEVFADWPQPSSAALVCTLEDVNAWLTAEGVPYLLDWRAARNAQEISKRVSAWPDRDTP